MEHKASLSPIASLRHWMTDTRTVSGSLSNSLEAMQTSYGRGLSRAQADASCCMEMAERFSSYASFGPGGVLKYARDYPLTHAAYDDLDVPAVDPNPIRLEVPYAGQKLHWMEGHAPDGSPVLIPAQFISGRTVTVQRARLNRSGVRQHPGRGQGCRAHRGHRAGRGRHHAF